MAEDASEEAQVHWVDDLVKSVTQSVTRAILESAVRIIANSLKVGDYVDVKATYDCVWHPAKIVYINEEREKFIASLLLDRDNSVCLRIEWCGSMWQPMGLLDRLVWETAD